MRTNSRCSLTLQGCLFALKRRKLDLCGDWMDGEIHSSKGTRPKKQTWIVAGIAALAERKPTSHQSLPNDATYTAVDTDRGK